MRVFPLHSCQKLRICTGLTLIATALLSACSSSRPVYDTGSRSDPAFDSKGRETGIASWYGNPYHGRQTASGEAYDMHELTAAHRTREFGTWVRVTRTDTGDDVEVRINDRGPFIEGRIIDLSFAAAKRIGLDVDGVAPVYLESISRKKVDPPPEREPAPVDDSNDCYWVQVGAFGDRANAARAVDRLKQAGEKALMIEGPSGLQRIRVGPFDEFHEAEDAQQRLLGEWPVAEVVECGG
ncbi:MAG: septal ring lytic transglycosylase RlpA family protein [bacterium]|nr:septal ring lytic transglycosylase RlpA family protein [bacterium]